jgi:hypothetical protein
MMPFGKPSRKWEYNIKTVLSERDHKGVGRTLMDFVKTVTKINTTFFDQLNKNLLSKRTGHYT